MSKMTIKMRKIGRMNLRMNFELSRSKLGYRATLIKILDKKFFTPFLRHFWLIEAKIKMKMKNFWKLSSVFDSPHENLYGNFDKNLWIFFFYLRHFWLIEANIKMKTNEFGKMSLIFEYSIMTQFLRHFFSIQLIYTILKQITLNKHTIETLYLIFVDQIWETEKVIIIKKNKK